MKIDIESITEIHLDGVDRKDYPDFADAFVMYAEHENGEELTEDELDWLNENHPEIAQEEALSWFVGD